ncbi:hypothetical protein SDC9_168104 [bioreactor metagenome]|uniref:GIY-YIG domain-containing protein n=1 Tax=bioreactor metagenome TaxID=1076179 RepID=A0A645G270_9ZZZZ|nr:GIY-YIG nuclease family protein [Lachnospiraceae bacterium]
MDRKKELKAIYKEMKPAMGIYLYQCIPTGKAYIGASQRLKAFMNRINFQLGMGSFLNKALQNDWNQYGEGNFIVKVLDILEYDKNDEVKKDYSEDLAILLAEWMGKFENAEVIL